MPWAPWKLGSRAGVDIHHAVGERREQRGVHHAHVTGHHHVLDAGGAELGGDDLVGLQRVGVHLLGERERLDARRLGALEPVGGGTARDHELDLRVEIASVDGVDQRLEVGARARQQHADGELAPLAIGPLGRDELLEPVVAQAFDGATAHRCTSPRRRPRCRFPRGTDARPCSRGRPRCRPRRRRSR